MSEPEKPGGELRVDLRSPASITAYAVLGTLIVLALGHPVPYNNEHLYLIGAYRLFHSNFAVADPGLGDPLYGHLLFQLIAGTLTTALSLEVVGWLLRFVSWTATVTGVVLTAARIGVPPWMTAGAIVVWLSNGQSILAQEWVMGGAEAKAFAYPLLFFAMDALLVGRAYRAAILIGLGVSFHPLVGVQLGGALCLGALFLRRDDWRLLPFAGLVVLFSLPGVVAVLYGARGGQALTVADWEFLARFAFPFHVDPTSFARRHYLTLGILLSFNLVVCWRLRNEGSYRLFGVAQVALALLFMGGLAAWWLEAYSAMQLMPFRVLPVLVMLLFLLFLADLARRRWSAPTVWVMGAWGLLALSEPVAGIVDQRVHRAEVNRYPTEVFDWIARETSNDALVLSPPSATNSISRSRRGQVAYYRWVRMRDLDDWRNRLVAVLGPPEATSGPGEWLSQYDALTPERVREVQERYGATHWVTRGAFDLPLLYQDAGGWRVYALGDP